MRSLAPARSLGDGAAAGAIHRPGRRARNGWIRPGAQCRGCGQQSSGITRPGTIRAVAPAIASGRLPPAPMPWQHPRSPPRGGRTATRPGLPLAGRAPGGPRPRRPGAVEGLAGGFGDITLSAGTRTGIATATRAARPAAAPRRTAAKDRGAAQTDAGRAHDTGRMRRPPDASGDASSLRDGAAAGQSAGRSRPPGVDCFAFGAQCRGMRAGIDTRTGPDAARAVAPPSAGPPGFPAGPAGRRAGASGPPAGSPAPATGRGAASRAARPAPLNPPAGPCRGSGRCRPHRRARRGRRGSGFRAGCACWRRR